MEQKYTIDGFAFQNAADYERAKKEKETVLYLSANTDMTDMKAVYKVYKLSIEKKSFQTVFGLNYLDELRERLVGSGIVKEDALDPIPVGRVVVRRTEKPVQTADERKLQTAQEQYRKAKSGSMIKNFLIIILVLIIAAMLVITSKNQYSILTYFTDYKENMRNELVNEYEEWESQLNDKEQELDEREKMLDEQEKE